MSDHAIPVPDPPPPYPSADSEDSEDDELEWEEWDGKGSFVHHCIAGSIAGIAEHTLMYPFDNVKTHMQCNHCPGQPVCKSVKPPPPTSLMNTLRSIIHHPPSSSMVQSVGSSASSVGSPSPLRLWRGVHTMFLGCVPAHALYFSSFELSKRALGVDQPGHHMFAAGACGAFR